jgi:hypothetical protein
VLDIFEIGSQELLTATLQIPAFRVAGITDMSYRI